MEIRPVFLWGGISNTSAYKLSSQRRNVTYLTNPFADLRRKPRQNPVSLCDSSKNPNFNKLLTPNFGSGTAFDSFISAAHARPLRT
jgi:hypothetical protein